MTAAQSEISGAGFREAGGKAAAAPVSLISIAGRLIGMMRRRRGLLLLSVLCSTGAAIASLLPYAAVALALAGLLGGTANPEDLVRLGLLALAGVLGRQLLFGVATLLSHQIAFATQEELRLQLAGRLARLPLGFFDGVSKGELRTVLLDDVEAVEDGMAHLAPELSAAIVAPCLAVLVLALIDWRLTLLALLPLGLGLVLIGRVMRRGEEATHDYFAIQAAMAATVAETADGLPTVRAFNQDGQAAARARAVFAQMTAFSDAWARRAVVPGAVAQVLLSSHLLFAAPAGLLMAAAGLIETERLAAFLAVTYGLGDVFSSLQGLSHRLMKQVEILNRIDSILCAPEMPIAARPAVPTDASVRFAAASFSYGSRRVLDGIELAVAPGQCLALVGPSGSGKSTLARLIARFHDVEAGAVEIGGVDVRQIAPDVLNAQIGFVFQEVFLFAGTVVANLRLARPQASDAEVVAAARAAQAHDFIMALPKGYDTPLGERGLGLSTGERQRLSIARAILKDAPILVLDEATAFADPENETLIQDAIAALAERRTLIVIAHRLHTIARADMIAVLNEGQLAELGPHEALLAQDGLYAAMWRAQEEVRRHRHAGGPDPLAALPEDHRA